MSCQNNTAPVDISMSKITGNCDLKCDYGFNYNNSSCIGTNRGNYITLSYDKSTSPPVLYNSAGYDVSEIRLYTPSLHSYNGNKSEGELIIIHKSVNGTKPLLVCIPIKVSNALSSESSILLKKIIETISNNAPSSDESTTINMMNYNLNLFIPQKPYFSYSGIEPFQPCSEEVDYIVFDIFNSSLDISSDTLLKLESIIEKNIYDVKPTINLFYNKLGPSKINGSSKDNIYIDCQPVGVSEEEEAVIIENNSDGEPLFNYEKDFFSNYYIYNITYLLLGSVIFIVLLVGLSYVIKLIIPSSELNNIDNIKNNVLSKFK